MKRSTTSLTCSILLIVLATTGPSAAVVVTFPDANLEAAVRNKLDIPASIPILDTYMETMTSLHATYYNISSIEGLQYATNLSELWLYGNHSIHDLSPIAGLTNLTSPNLNFNQISDISVVSGMPNMLDLSLINNPLGGDLSAIYGLTN